MFFRCSFKRGVILLICSKCRKLNTDEAKFCRKCGAPLNDKTQVLQKPKRNFVRDNKKLIKISAIVCIVVVILVAYAFVFNTPLQSQNFGKFSISVPYGSNFVDDGVPYMDENGEFASYKNIGLYSKEFYFIEFTSVSSFDIPSNFNLVGKEGSLNVYQNVNRDVYLVIRDEGDYEFVLMGNNQNVLKQSANSIEFHR